MKRVVWILLTITCFAGCETANKPTTKIEEDMDYARYWYTRGHFEEAIKKFQDALSKNPNLIDAHLGLANSRRELGKIHFSSKERNAIDAEHNLAILSFRKALELERDNLVAYYGLGQLYYERAMALESIFTPEERKSYRNECIKYFEKVISKEPGNFQAHRYLGIAYSTIPDKKKALEHLGIYLAYLDANIANLKRLQPTEDVRKQISLLERQANDIREIVKSLEKLE